VQPLRGNDGTPMEGVPHRFAHPLHPVQGPHGSQHRGGVGALAAPGLEQVAVTAPGEPQGPVARGERGPGDAGCFRGDGFDGQWTPQEAPPKIGLKPSRWRAMVPVLEELHQQYQKCGRAIKIRPLPAYSRRM